MSRLGKILLLLVVLAAISAGAYAVVRNGQKKEGGFKEVEVTQGTIVEKAVAVGQIQPRQKFQVKSKISGIVRRALVEVAAPASASPKDPIVRRYRLARVAVYTRPQAAPDRFAHTRRSPH